MALNLRWIQAAAALIIVSLFTGCVTAGRVAVRNSGVTEATASRQGGMTRSPSTSMAEPAPAASPRPASTARPTASASVRAVAPGAGRRPQTGAFPSADSAAFRNAMADLWLAVTTGHPDAALPGFFPLAAYQQLKVIYDPARDWHDRLWADFTLDVAAAHRLLDEDGQGEARLARVVVPAAEASWISPGVCANSIGYWHVAGARVVYRQDGQLHSFGIASLISWRGDWYVVHFGAVLRDSATGIVDQPTAGEGVPGPPGGC